MPARRAALWFVCAFAIYMANGRAIAMGDSLPGRYQPLGILAHHSLSLEPWLPYLRDPYTTPYWVLWINGRAVSLYPVMTPVVVSPLYIPARLYLKWVAWKPSTIPRLSELMEKVAASTLAALTVSFVWLTLLRLGSPHALLLTIACAFGTSLWTINSQGLWQHGLSSLGFVIAVWAFTGPATWRSVVIAGAALGVAGANRYQELPIFLALSTYAVWWARERVVAMGLLAAVPLGWQTWYFWTTYGHLLGGYGVSGVASLGFFNGQIALGLAGLLVSPSRGLLVFAPFLAWAWRSPRQHPQPVLAWALLAGVTVQILFYALTDWRAGYSYGPRFLTETMPLLVFLLAGVRTSPAFYAAILWSIGTQAIGAFCYKSASDLLIHAPNQAWKYQNAWALKASPIYVELVTGLAQMPFFDPAWWAAW